MCASIRFCMCGRCRVDERICCLLLSQIRDMAGALYKFMTDYQNQQAAAMKGSASQQQQAGIVLQQPAAYAPQMPIARPAAGAGAGSAAGSSVTYAKEVDCPVCTFRSAAGTCVQLLVH